MKINYLRGSIAIRQCDGYTENLEFNVTETKGLIFRYPYGDATPEEAEAVSQFVKTVTNAYNKLTTQIDNVNRDLELEQYAPKVSVAETSSESTTVSAVPQPLHGTCSNNLDCTDLVAHSEAEQERLDMEEELKEETAASQTCALGDGEGLTVPEIVQYSLEATEIHDAPFEEAEPRSDKA